MTRFICRYSSVLDQPGKLCLHMSEFSHWNTSKRERDKQLYTYFYTVSAKIAQILAPAHYMSIKGCVFRYCKNFREKVMVISLIRQATYSRILPRKLQCGERYMNCTCSEKLCYVSSGKTGKEKLVSHHGFWFGSLLCSKLPTSLFLLFFLILFFHKVTPCG